jgi:DNA repair photolyase
LVKHTFKDTVFISTTTYQLTKKTNKRRQNNGKEIKVITKAPLDPKILDALSHQCLEVDDDSD